MEKEQKALYDAIIGILQVYEKEITLDSSFEVNLGADSIDMAQIYLRIEENLGIKFDENRLRDIATVKDALDEICRLTANDK